jgi:hypothetical protein
VFVLGAPRSGTTWLYHMLLSSGNFAVYRAESLVLNLLEPRFGNLAKARNRRNLLAAWGKTKLFTRTGLEMASLEPRIMAECRNGGDFLRIFMEEMARQQSVERWADCTPDHVLHLARIRETIPDALVIHVIRDGRDTALSMTRQGYPQTLPGDSERRFAVAALYWEWMVRKGRRDGKKFGANYIEVRYEDMVASPQAVLDVLGPFVGQALDYEQIRRVGIGSVTKPNTGFHAEAERGHFVGRWRWAVTSEDQALVEGLVGNTLCELGFTLENRRVQRLGLSTRRAIYRGLFQCKHYTRTKTPLGRLLVTDDISWSSSIQRVRKPPEAGTPLHDDAANKMLEPNQR